jgi:hypothetical protein
MAENFESGLQFEPTNEQIEFFLDNLIKQVRDHLVETTGNTGVHSLNYNFFGGGMSSTTPSIFSFVFEREAIWISNICPFHEKNRLSGDKAVVALILIASLLIATIDKLPDKISGNYLYGVTNKSMVDVLAKMLAPGVLTPTKIDDDKYKFAFSLSVFNRSRGNLQNYLTANLQRSLRIIYHPRKIEKFKTLFSQNGLTIPDSLD